MKHFYLIILIFNSSLYSQHFQEMSEELGINYFAAGEYGSGLSLYDWNEDGFDDVVLLCKDSVPAFFLNNHTGFSRVYFEGITINNDIKSVCWVDINNDGALDLSFNSHLGGPTIYLNQGNFTFVDITESTGIAQRTTDWGFGHCWGDFDHDGDLDLFVANYNWIDFDDGFNHIYRNNGDLTFDEVSFDIGVDVLKEPTFIGLWLDYNNDNLTDLFVLNDRNQYVNYLYVNTGNDVLSSQGEQTNFSIIMDSMCATAGDYNNDGYFDMYITNTPGFGNRLFKNNELGAFQETAANLGLQMFEWSWGSVWIDVQNRGWLDLFVVTQPNIPFERPGRHFLFTNTTQSFELAQNAGFEGSEDWTFATARCDFNNDGKPDLITHSYDSLGTEIWINDSEDVGNYLKVRIKGTISNIEGIGSRIELLSSFGNQYRYTFCGEQYISQNSQWQHFGLGEMSTIDSLVVKWPSGVIDYYLNVPANQQLVLTEGETYMNQILVSEGALVFCEGDSVILSGGGNYESYQWSTGDSTKFITVSQSDTISLVVMDGLLPVNSDTVITQALPIPVGDYLIQNPLCAGANSGSIELVLNTNFDNLQFLWQDGSTEQNRFDLPSGNYSVEVSYNQRCPQVLDFLLENPEPFLLDSIIYNLNTENELCANSYTIQSFYQGGTSPYIINWEVRDESGMDLINSYQGEILDCVSAEEARWVKCVIVDSLGCLDSLSILTAPIVSVQELNNDFKVFPNPSKDVLNIQCKLAINRIQVFNEFGIVKIENKLEENTKAVKLSLANLKPGNYILAIHHSSNPITYTRITVVK